MFVTRTQEFYNGHGRIYTENWNLLPTNPVWSSDRLLKFDMIQVHLFHGNELLPNVKISPQTSLAETFESARERMKIPGTADEFLVFCGDAPFPIDQRPIGTLPFQQHTQKNLIFISKSDMETISGFMNTTMASLIAESGVMNQQAMKMLDVIIVQWGTLAKHQDESVFAQVMSVLPDSLIDGAEGDAVVEILAKWFKEEFFTFVKEIPCRLCGAKTQGVGAGPATRTEHQSLARNVEVYKCEACGAMTRWPRYNWVPKLLETRKGRCGEFALTFAVMLQTLGYDARVVIDFADHIWCEFWSDEKNRYVHVDPCEGIVDKPLVYEEGWKKHYLWVIALGINQCQLVTQKYSRKMAEHARERNSMVSDELLDKYISFEDSVFKATLNDDEKSAVLCRQEADKVAMESMRSEVQPEEQQPRISGQ